MYLVQTVSSRGRPWSSFTDIRTTKELDINMYGVKEVADGNVYSPLLARRPAGTSYDLPGKEVKKDKKWSFGNIFRKKKKHVSESSSEEDTGKIGFLQRRKRKTSSRKKPTKVVGKFDHVVISQNPHCSYNVLNGCTNEEPSGVLSDPTYNSSRISILPDQENTSNQYLNVNYPASDRSDVNVSRNSLASADSTSRKNRKELTKLRAEARRENIRCESSSDEESQRSGSSATKFRSDESLSKYSSLSRRSRAARTERYLRRLSKDEEPRDQKLCKSDIENGKLPDTRQKAPSPSTNLVATQCNKVPFVANYYAFDPSGTLTIPPSHNNSKRNRNYTVDSCCFNAYIPSSYGSETRATPPKNQRSWSYEGSMDKRSSPCEIIHGKLPLGIPTSRNGTPNGKTPPLPPPRDPRRIVSITAFDGSRPNSFCFENGASASKNRSPILPYDKRRRNVTDTTGMHAFRSTSEDQISVEPVIHSLTVRPASTTPETSRKHLTKENDFTYFVTDSNPRSRRPLTVQPFINSDNTAVNNLHNGNSKASQTFNFWKQKEDELVRQKTDPIARTSVASPVSNRLVNDENKNETPQSALLVSAVSKSPISRVKGLPRESSPFRPISPVPKMILNSLCRSKSVSPGVNSSVESQNGLNLSPNSNTKKPENLEDALNELEEIYNSLRLGDEDLLDRAEKREADICKEAANNISSKNQKKRYERRSADIKEDDLAFRKYNKERSKTIGDPHSVTSSISYLLTSPISGDILLEPDNKQKNKKEPDVTFDDLVYRSIKQTNNTLKVLDPQPPFGIPIGPISGAPNSDYLHAHPESVQQERVSKKVPDIVKDDLAYRSLRKDPNKEPVLPPVSPVGDANNNKAYLLPLQKYSPNSSFRRKRAVRSLSANLFNIMQKENQAKNEADIARSLTEIADAMETTRQLLKEKEKSITATRKGFVSDGEAAYSRELSLGLEHLNKNRASFLNGMKSPDAPNLPSNSNKDVGEPDSKTLDELLTALAVETRETSDRITNELRMLGEGDILKSSLKIHTNNNKLEKTDDITKQNNCVNPAKKTSPASDLLVNANSISKTPHENTLNMVESLSDENRNFQNTPQESLTKHSIVIDSSANNNIQADVNVSETGDIPAEVITRTFSDVTDAKADHEKMCEKLIGCIFENAQVISDDVEPEQVQQIASDKSKTVLAEKSVANIVLTPKEGILPPSNPIETEVHSEPDYENLKCLDDEEDTQEDTDSTSKTSLDCKPDSDVMDEAKIDSEEKASEAKKTCTNELGNENADAIECCNKDENEPSKDEGDKGVA